MSAKQAKDAKHNSSPSTVLRRLVVEEAENQVKRSRKIRFLKGCNQEEIGKETKRRNKILEDFMLKIVIKDRLT